MKPQGQPVGPLGADLRTVVVVGVDGSAESEFAASWAADEAVRRGTSLRLVHAYGESGISNIAEFVAPDDLMDLLHDAGAGLLDRLSATLTVSFPDLTIGRRLVHDEPVSALRTESADACLTVIGCRNGGRLRDAMFGSVTLPLASVNTVPVATVSPERQGRAGGPILVGADCTANSGSAIEFAFQEAILRGTGLVALYSWRDELIDASFSLKPPKLYDLSAFQEGARQALDEQLAPSIRKYPSVQVDQIVSPQRPTMALLEYSPRAQLVVVGDRSRGGFQRLLLGSTSQSLITHGKCPVAVVRPNNARV